MATRYVLTNIESKNVLICSRAIFVQHESIAFPFILLLFLLTLGPPLPKAIYGLSMLEVHGDLYVIGGRDSSGTTQSAIYQLICSSGLCSWTTFNQQLKVGRRYAVAIAVQDNFCT